MTEYLRLLANGTLYLIFTLSIGYDVQYINSNTW